MSTTRELHERAMDLYEQALLAARRKDKDLTKRLLANALRLEAEAADSVAGNHSLEPTRSILHRSAATIALKAGDLQVARKYAEAGLQGEPPAEIAAELSSLIEQTLTLEAATTRYALRTSSGKTRFKEIIDKYTSQAPVDILGLANELGIEVRQAALGPDRSGEIFLDTFRGGSSGFSIRVNSAHPITRKRFTIAHETAHYLRHRNRIGNRLVHDVMYRSRLGPTVESEANALAAHLLMPSRLVQKFNREGLTPEQMAQRFKVSLRAMKNRLRIRE